MFLLPILRSMRTTPLRGHADDRRHRDRNNAGTLNFDKVKRGPTTAVAARELVDA